MAEPGEWIIRSCRLAKILTFQRGFTHEPAREIDRFLQPEIAKRLTAFFMERVDDRTDKDDFLKRSIHGGRMGPDREGNEGADACCRFGRTGGMLLENLVEHGGEQSIGRRRG